MDRVAVLKVRLAAGHVLHSQKVAAVSVQVEIGCFLETLFDRIL